MSETGFECEIMSWDLFIDLSKKVAEKIITSKYQPDIIIGIARGGWVLSRILCDYLGIKDLLSLKIEHWGITATPEGKAQIKYPFKINLTGKNVLIVDDITDTGESMLEATNYIEKLNPKEIKTAALRHIIGSKFIPSYYAEKIEWRWVVFPWNFVEDMCNIIPKIINNGIEIDEMKERLKSNFSIELTKNQILEIMKEIKRRAKMKT